LLIFFLFVGGGGFFLAAKVCFEVRGLRRGLGLAVGGPGCLFLLRYNRASLGGCFFRLLWFWSGAWAGNPLTGVAGCVFLSGVLLGGGFLFRNL